MTELDLVTDPDDLNEFHITAGLSSLNTGGSAASPDPAPRTRTVKLVLLQPLANPDMLAACRNPDSRVTRRSTGNSGDTSTSEFLDIRPLSKAWRQATMNVPPFSHLIFDLTLPKANEARNDSFRKVYWDIGMPQGDTLSVETRDVMNLVVTIATETRIRAKGNVCFEIVYDEDEGAAPRVLTRLDKQLLALQKFPGKKDVERVNGH
ncbi:hypothetical protein CNMCM8980_008686 [Aspergillus fumigatiaffinis]|jgi:hypothetical protein|uniref:Uncharacterized protein n=1 Tax=Aspergillus fumigatiaffinis TaxID=340414 RepID=A0A8H4GJF7_9EURO|nr:hypothetical protein CNMCM5878_002189 [Aspergillus fumigatiaffinis]KAF4223178.1 hypothetical protein CNMCM6457_000667 [Aspergillus fumigatiaffinis]KAF4229150.1 hypothetical protein CNMCM6805_001602 [Aspergillus fumigatiaffinis]KAF4246378.1 hypothetical protein CNMCM8980_008686 [Aspergillus fumigatiaffinis]